MTFYAPMASIEFEDLLSVGTDGQVAGEAINDFMGFVASFFDDRVTLYSKNLADKGEVEVIVELSGGPNGA